MTNAEAIETLRANYPDACFEQLREAVDAAIEALKAQNAAGDTISRRAAIEALEREQSLIERPITETRWFDFGLRKAQDVLSELPSADAAPVKHGEWSTYDVSGYRKCSMCGGYVNWNPKPFLFGDGEYNYCPNCGAKMKEEG